MKIQKIKEVPSPIQLETISTGLKQKFTPEKTVRYIGSVTRATNDRVLKEIAKLQFNFPQREVVLFITSNGGATGTAMSFYDMLNQVIKPNLITIGSGDVDSSGIIIFLSGKKRYITKNTTLLFHSAGRVFGNMQRFTVRDMETMLGEDRLKDEQYASLVALNSKKKLSKNDVLKMMHEQTVLSPDRLVELGLADAVLL